MVFALKLEDVQEKKHHHEKGSISNNISNLQQEVPSRKLTYPTFKRNGTKNHRIDSKRSSIFWESQKKCVFFCAGEGNDRKITAPGCWLITLRVTTGNPRFPASTPRFAACCGHPAGKRRLGPLGCKWLVVEATHMKICESQNGFIFPHPNRGENRAYLKPPPS